MGIMQAMSPEEVQRKVQELNDRLRFERNKPEYRAERERREKLYRSILERPLPPNS